MRHNRHNRPSAAVMSFISNGWDYYHGANGGDDLANDDQAAADAAAAAAQAAADAKARGDVIEDPAEAEKAAKEAADKAAAEKEATEKAAKEAEEAAKGDKSGTADEESEETEEEKAEREAQEAEEAKNKRIRVPKWRLDELAAKARQREEALTKRIQELEKREEQPKKDVLGEMRNKINELQDKYEAHVFEGQKDEAKAVRKELDELREKYTDTKVAASGAQARAQTIEALKYDAALAKVEADYPALNPDNPEVFDEDKSNEVAELMQMFAGNGMTRQAALEKAVKYVMGSPQQKKDASKDTTAETLRQKREQEARQKAAEANKRQPPDSTKTGADNDKGGSGKEGAVDVFKLTQEQFAKYDESTLAKLRGDEV